MSDSELLKTIVCSLVEYPDAVLVKRTTDEMGVLLSLSVDKMDMGKVIGREGGIATAIRTIIRAVGIKNQSRVNVKILEPDNQ